MKITYPKVKALDAAVTINTTFPIPGNVSNIAQALLEVEFGAGTSAGAVVLESAARADYTGTWVLEGTVTWAAASKAHNVIGTGPKGAWRVRISVAIVGGTVDAWFRGAS